MRGRVDRARLLSPKVAALCCASRILLSEVAFGLACPALVAPCAHSSSSRSARRAFSGQAVRAGEIFAMETRRGVIESYCLLPPVAGPPNRRPSL